MAQIIEERVTLVISRMVPDGDTTHDSVVSAESKEALQAVAQELVGEAAIVEVIEGQ